MLKITMDLLGKERLVRGFNGLVRMAGDLRPVWNSVHKDFMQMEREIFTRGGYPRKFKPLSPRYRARKYVEVGPKPIMVYDGTLRDSLTQRSHPNHIFDPGATKLRMGTSVIYAHRHQMGTFGMPQRKIIQLSKERKKDWAYRIHSYLVKGVVEKLKGKG